MDEIFGKLSEAGIDVDAALRVAQARAVAPLRRWNSNYPHQQANLVAPLPRSM